MSVMEICSKDSNWPRLAVKLVIRFLDMVSDSNSKSVWVIIILRNMATTFFTFEWTWCCLENVNLVFYQIATEINTPKSNYWSWPKTSLNTFIYIEHIKTFTKIFRSALINRWYIRTRGILFNVLLYNLMLDTNKN